MFGLRTVVQKIQKECGGFSMKEFKLLAPKAYPFMVFFLAVLLMWFVGKDSQSTKNYQLPSVIEEQYTCVAGASAPDEKLTVYVSSEVVARSLADMLCEQPVIKRQYHQVQAYWSGGDAAVMRFVGKGLGDLVNTKDNIVQAFDAENTYGYQRLASYAQYQTYLIALKEKPIISREYLLGRRIGLVDYPTSRSGHIVPKNMLRELGLGEDQVTIIYSHSHAGLRQLLASGEVDMISSYWSDADVARFSANYIQPIGAENISGTSWYMKMEKRNTDLFCTLQNSLANLAEQQTSTYFSQLNFAAGCPAQVVGR